MAWSASEDLCLAVAQLPCFHNTDVKMDSTSRVLWGFHLPLPGELCLEVTFLLLGASIVGVNCHFDPETSIETVRLMKEGLQAAKLKAHLMCQPLAFHTPDCGKQGFIDLPEFPFGKTRVYILLVVLLYWLFLAYFLPPAFSTAEAARCNFIQYDEP